VRAARSLWLRAADAADWALGRRDPLTPPRRRLDFVGDSDFRATGEEFLGLFRELAGLRPADRVLDVGCGIGRMARVLAGELRPPGSYDGFDIVGDAIAWCNGHYRDTPAPFAFKHADLHNSAYNPGGHGSARDYRFPYPDQSFDLAIATSVFTHLLGGEVDNYLSEVARVLAPGGRMFGTWLLAGDDVVGDAAAFRFAHRDGDAYLEDPAVPQMAVGYSEDWVRERMQAAGLRVRDPIHYGSWRGAPGVSFQDIVIAEPISA
jgi:SAM-dependent methyltransferase